MRNYPIVGRLRWLAEWFRPKITQYFVESDTDGKPFSRLMRSLAYQRSKGDPETVPFGTQLDLYKQGAEWVAHSIYPKNKVHDFRVVVGNRFCKQKYSSSRINSSAMSYGALSANAVMAIGMGARMQSFAQNTGEGGISEYHLVSDNDLIWQIGTGYFGCRDYYGNFDSIKYAHHSQLSQVKMIELKLSQGAKPGLGGLLPAKKNTPEIAKIRGIAPYEAVHSPAAHSAFKNNTELGRFVHELKSFSCGKPVGIKLCIGNKDEFMSMMDELIRLDYYPDFITVDGAEGGTGSAPIEFTNNVGMPLEDALTFVDNYLREVGKRDEIKIFASGRAISGFDVVKLLSLGADVVNMARGMMLSLGCIQALECHNDTCPTGITTHNPKLMRGLVVTEKGPRIASFHKKTLESVNNIINAMGVDDVADLNRSMIFKRSFDGSVKSYEDLYPTHKPMGSGPWDWKMDDTRDKNDKLAYNKDT